MNSFLSKVGYSAIYVYVEFFIGLVASILIARALGPADFGLYSYLIKVTAVLMVFVNGGVSTGVLRFLAEYSHDQADSKVVAYNVYRFFSKIQFVKCVVVIFVFYLVLHKGLDLIIASEHDTLLMIFVGGVILKSYYMFRVGALKGLERFDGLALIVAAVCPLYLLMVIVGQQREEGVEYFAYVYLATSFLFWAVSYWIIRRNLQKGKVELGNNFEERARSYVRIVTINTVLAALVIGYVEVFYLHLFRSDELVGYFNIGLTISAAAVNLVPGIYNSILMPAIVKNTVKNEGQDNDNSRQFVFGTIRHMLILTLFVAVPAAFYADELIELLYGVEYEAAVFPLAMMLCASVATAFNYPAVAYFVSKDRQGDMLKVHLYILLLSLGWAYYLTVNYGLVGAVYSYVFTTCLTAVCLVVLLVRDFKGVANPGLIIKSFIVSGVSIALVWALPIQAPLFVDIMCGSILYAVLFLMLAWYIGVFTTDERLAIKRIAGKFRRVG